MEQKVEIKKEIKKVDWYDDRFYRVTGASGQVQYLPSVTTILSIINKPFLASWRGSVGNVEADRISEIATKKGSKIHEACELITNGTELIAGTYDQSEWVQIIRYFNFLEKINPKIIETEKIIIDEVLGYAGTADLIFEIEKIKLKINSEEVELPAGLYLLDIKTGSNVYDDYWMQLAAYYMAIKKDSPLIIGALIIHLNAKNKDGFKVYYKSESELLPDFENFKNCLNLFQRKAIKIEPKIMEMPESLKWEFKKSEPIVKVKKVKITKPKTKKIKELKNELL